MKDLRKGMRLLVVLLGIAVPVTGLTKEKPLELKTPDDRITAPLHVASLNRLGGAALSGSPSKLGGFTYAFDRVLDTAYEARDAGPVQIDVAFAKPQSIRKVRLLLGPGEYRWSLQAADSRTDLEAKEPRTRPIVRERTRLRGTEWEDVNLAAPIEVKVLRLMVTPAAPADSANVRELELWGEQSLEAISLDTPSRAVQIGELTPIEVTGYFSGGQSRLITGKGMRWTIKPETFAKMSSHNRLLSRRLGPLEVSAAFGKIVSPPLPLEVVEGF